MEVAGQWRREWAGTAEYGKVTEGGVTRRVARAMEVLHASAPGARVRVMRAAYHSTAASGAPAASYLLHSSRRVISSGYDFIEPTTPSTKPLEISSTPLESSPDIEMRKENYEVTEPDDLEISEPSKWRASKNKNSMRMPSEESSSTDNTSIIDLDYQNKIIIQMNKSQNNHKENTPISLLLDAPVALSTLKYKSLLNGSDSWNNRRKSYSFEDTPDINESVFRGNDILTMDSSTDSGICKSSEIVDDSYNTESLKNMKKNIKMDDIHEETFKDWLSKNTQKSFISPLKSNKERSISTERTDDSNIILQSAGKVSITLPTSTLSDDYEQQKSKVTEDYDRKTKKVEFCKTELHFAAETGTVNIIATDEKPPPSSDFRKKRSVFIPITDNFNKSITLFGEKSEFNEISKKECYSLNSENIIDENTAATKSILKNKIPKPKPYLLGENMVFGESTDLTVKDNNNDDVIVASGVSLINRQLKSGRTFSTEVRSNYESEIDWGSCHKSAPGTSNKDPVNLASSNLEIQPRLNRILDTSTKDKNISDIVKSKVKVLQMSPTPARSKTRQLRESDLTYFGVANVGAVQKGKQKYLSNHFYDENNSIEEILHSVKLVQSVSNSVCNSEVDSDEAPDYQNLPVKYNVAPKAAPRIRPKINTSEIQDLQPILEKVNDEIPPESRRIKQRTLTPNNRSLSEPPKPNNFKAVVDRVSTAICKDSQTKEYVSKHSVDNTEKSKKKSIKAVERKKRESPLYINLQQEETKKHLTEQKKHNLEKEESNRLKNSMTKQGKSLSTEDKKATANKPDTEKQQGDWYLEKNKNNIRRTKILLTPEQSPSKNSDILTKKYKVDSQNTLKGKTSPVANPCQQKYRINKTVSQDTTKDSFSSIDNKEIRNNKGNVKLSNNKNNRHKLSIDTTSTDVSSKQQTNICKNMIVHDIKPINIQYKSGRNKERNDSIQNKSKRSKYVINYDDKNGTVSSICKIMPGTSKKKVINYENKENSKEQIVKANININKNDLLQAPEQQRNLYGSKKLKSKAYARKSCQIL